MTRSIQRLALLIPSILAVAALTATAAWAGDRYSQTDPRADEYVSSDYGYQSDIDPGGAYGDSRWNDRSSWSRSEYDRRDSRSRTYSDEQVYEAEQMDPCAVQYRVTGRGCAPDQGSYRGGGMSREGSAWRSERVYDEERASAYDRAYDADGYVDACVVAHERVGERCPYAERRTYRDQDRVVWVEERLPDTFFISEGGVGPGIVDYGGGGGGGGGFGFADGLAGANASASASASAQASVSLAIAVHNHGMGYPHKMPHGGCGCKKGY